MARTPADRFYVAALFECLPDAIIGTGVDDSIASWNPAAERMFGYTAAEAIGQSASILVPPALQEQHADLRGRAVEGESIRDFETVRLRKDGTPVAVTLNVAPVRNGRRKVLGLLGVLRELDDRTGVIAGRRLAAIVASSDDAIVSKDLHGIVTSWNQAAERMFGYSAAEMVGQSIRRIIPNERQQEEDHVLERIRRGDKVDHFDTMRRHKDGHLIPISLTVSPIRDERGGIVGASKIARDISERRAAESERVRLLKAAQEQVAITDSVNRVGRVVSSTLDRTIVTQVVTDTATQVTGAEFGAFFYNATDEHYDDEIYQLYSLSGASMAAVSTFPHLRATEIFGPTFPGEGVVRLADVTQDQGYGNPPYYGTPDGRVPVRSYLAVPVRARSGGVLGALVFGHSQPGVFAEHHEQLAEGIASWASLALENAQLYIAAQRANRLKDDFLATLSHELRTPLNAIMGYAQMVRAGVMTGEKHERAMEAIERNTRVLTQIVDDVLDVSRIVAGKIRLNVQPVNLLEVVHHAVDVVRPAAVAKGVRLETQVGMTPSVPGDPDRLQQVIWNLLSNAVKFTPSGGAVHVTLNAVNAHVELDVTDTGAGISKAFLPHVFERFRQADGVSRERGGLGLGLSIAKHLVELHGGTIAAFSEGEGKGATFHIELPQ